MYVVFIGVVLLVGWNALRRGRLLAYDAAAAGPLAGVAAAFLVTRFLDPGITPFVAVGAALAGWGLGHVMKPYPRAPVLLAAAAGGALVGQALAAAVDPAHALAWTAAGGAVFAAVGLAWREGLLLAAVLGAGALLSGGLLLAAEDLGVAVPGAVHARLAVLAAAAAYGLRAQAGDLDEAIADEEAPLVDVPLDEARRRLETPIPAWRLLRRRQRAVQKAALAALDDVARGLGPDAARVEVARVGDDLAFRLVPTNEDATALTVAVGDQNDIHYFLGQAAHHATASAPFVPTRVVARRIRRWAEAVARGAVEETVWTRVADDGEVEMWPESYAKVGVGRTGRRLGSPVVFQPGWEAQEVRYAPYAPSSSASR